MNDVSEVKYAELYTRYREAPMLAEEHEWYEEFGRKIKEVE